jgi:hypothetical protein
MLHNPATNNAKKNVIVYNNHGTWMDIEPVLDVYTLNTTVQTTELTMNQLNEYLWDNPAPAPASDNSEETTNKVEDTLAWLIGVTSIVILVLSTAYTIVSMWERL